MSIHRLLFLPAFLLLLLGGATCYGQSSPQADTHFHIYLLTGQSNMAGRAALDAESAEIDPQIFMLDKENNWVPAKDPLHFDKPAVVGVGPGIAFAKEMLKGEKGVKIGLVPCAVGGSPISVWAPDSVYLAPFHPYDDAIHRVRIAMKRGVLKGILWHQGESDNNPESVGTYMEKLKTLIGRFRSDLGMPDLPFVAGEIGYFTKNPLINPIIDGLSAQLPHTAVVSAKGLTDKGDQTHFDTRSARELGRRYAQAMRAMPEH